MASCADCVFMRPQMGSTTGMLECHCHPPSVPVGGAWGIWPTVHPDSWCGEHQPATREADVERTNQG